MKVSILGSGAMGSGIAEIAAIAGETVILYDKYPEALNRSKKQFEKRMQSWQESGKITRSEAANIDSKITYTAQLEDIAESELVIETIVENLSLKQALFRRLESMVSKQCILATNTSSLSVTAIAAACRKTPERVIGIHFFIPAPQIKLVEIVPALQTAPNITSRSKEIIKSWGKTTVSVKDVPGFLVNRIARPYYLESIRMLDEGLANIATIDWACTELGGFNMGPFTLMDYIGNDINFTFTKDLYQATAQDNRYKPSVSQQRLVEAGYLGRKTGRGFYNYSERYRNPAPNKNESLGKKILVRLLVLLINEAADALHYGYASQEDIDLAMTSGIRFPYGLLAWADDLGISFCVNQIDALYELYREDRYRCSPLLRQMKKRAERFY